MPTRVKGCYHCSRRRINCDRTEPQCLKCIRTNLECSGLGTRYRWAKAVKQSTLTGKASTRSPRKKQAKSSSVEQECEQTTALEIDPFIMDFDLTASWPDSPSTSNLGFPYSPTSTACTEPEWPVSLLVAPTSHQDQWAINFFATDVSRWICPTRNSSNEFFTLLAPFALESPEVFSAMAAAAFHRLAYYGNDEFSAKAERYKSSAISGILNKAQQVSGTTKSRENHLAAMAVIIIMIYDDMISAQNYFRFLAPIMKSLHKMVSSSVLETDSLGTFLAEQMGLLLVLCLPYFEPGEEQRHMAQQALKFLESFASRSDRHPNAPFLAFCLRLSVSVWSRKMENPHCNVDPILESFKLQLEGFRDLDDLDHYLTWVYFNCAAASLNQELRQFFAGHLQDHMRTHGFKNIPLMLQLLQRLWKDERRWPLTLQSHCEYICA